jgi:hypothetical protein
MGAPELDHRVDLFALGVMLYESLTGEVPWPGTYPEVLIQHGQGAPLRAIAPLRHDVPVAVDELLARALAREPEDRFDSAASFVAALTRATGLEMGASALLGAATPRAGVRAEQVLSASLPPAAPARKAPPPLPDAALRRRHARAAYVAPLRARLHDGSYVDGRTEDISAGGVLAVLDRTLPDGAEVEVRFVLPLTGTVASLTATARWARTGRGLAAVGLAFHSVDAATRATIERYVRLVSAASPEGTS